MAGGWRVLYPGQRDDSCFDLMYLLAGGVDNRGMFLISAAKKTFLRLGQNYPNGANCYSYYFSGFVSCLELDFIQF